MYINSIMISSRSNTTDREIRVVWCKYQNLLFDHHHMKSFYQDTNQLDVWEQIRIDLVKKRKRDIAELKTQRYFDIYHKSVHPPPVGP